MDIQTKRIIVLLVILCGSVLFYVYDTKVKDNIKRTFSVSSNIDIFKHAFIPSPRNITGKKFIGVDLTAGLGNQMFHYAGLYGMAKRTNRVPYACIEYNIGKLFPNLTIKLYPRKMCKKIKPAGTPRLNQRNSALYYDPSMYQKIMATNTSHVFMCCAFQNVGFFMEYFDDLRSEFSLAQSYRDLGNNYLNMAFQKAKNSTPNVFAQVSSERPLQFVGIHVRRGDHLSFTGLIAATPEYFSKAMGYFRSKYKERVIFIVASDDREWCKTNIKGDDVIFTGWKSREDDFSIQLSCNHTIASIGTFGWWMGFLTKGETIVFRDYAGTSKFKDWYLPGQRYPDDWKLM